MAGLNASLGEHIKRLREARRLTQEEFATLAGLAADTVRRLEHGQFSPSMRTIRKVARGLDISLTALFGGFELRGLEYPSEFVDLFATRPLAEQQAIARLWRTLAAELDERNTAEPKPVRVVQASRDGITLKSFGQHLRALRKVRRRTQAQLAESADLSMDTIGRLENGAFSPSIDTLIKLCRGLGIEVSTLFLALEVGAVTERGVERQLADMLYLRSTEDRVLALLVLRNVFEMLDGD